MTTYEVLLKVYHRKTLRFKICVKRKCNLKVIAECGIQTLLHDDSESRNWQLVYETK